MSEVALRDNKVPESPKMNGSLGNGNCIKPQVENSEEKQRKGMTSLVAPIKADETENSESLLANSEIEYTESEDLKDLEDVEDCLKVRTSLCTSLVHRVYALFIPNPEKDVNFQTLLSGLGSKDWVSVCDSLNSVRRLSIFHKEAIVSILDDVISLTVKSLKNPRSAVCKTAIMTTADLFKSYTDEIIDSLDPMLVQLLLKSSQDKRFVCEAAESALIALSSWVSPHLLLPKLLPYVKNRNPRIRAKASLCISRSVSRLGVDGIRAFGIDKLIEIGVSQLSDRLPESRDAARALLLELQSAYEKSHVQDSSIVSDEPSLSWEDFCKSKLSPLSAQAVLRVTNTTREGLVTGS